MENHLMEISPNPSPPLTPLTSTPLNLSGFFHDNTIEVQGDTQNLQFSLQFNVKHNSSNSNPQIQTSFIPIPTQDVENRNQNTESLINPSFDQIVTTQECVETNECTIMTRLRSGVLSPVKYSKCDFGVMRGRLWSWSEGKSRKRRRGNRSVLERVIRRHSFPIRPCSSYAFFVMVNWGVVKCFSFGETSKKLCEMWYNLSNNEKVFEEMSVKDNERYQRQCLLLRSHDQED